MEQALVKLELEVIVLQNKTVNLSLLLKSLKLRIAGKKQNPFSKDKKIILEDEDVEQNNRKYSFSM